MTTTTTRLARRHSAYRASQLLLEEPHPAASASSIADNPHPAAAAPFPADATVQQVLGGASTGPPQLPAYVFPDVSLAATEVQAATEPVWQLSPPPSPVDVDMDRPASPLAARSHPALTALLKHAASVPPVPVRGGPSAPAALASPSKPAPRRVPSDPELFCGDACGDGHGPEAAPTLLDATLTALWEDRADQGLFRYDVSSCPSRVLPGSLGFVAQLNVGRATLKRATEFKVDQVVQPFDAGKFNFSKARLSEVLLQFEPRPAAALQQAAAEAMVCGRGRGRAAGSMAPTGGGGMQLLLRRAPAAVPSPNLVLINVSPIERGHVLLIPRALSSLPQLVDEGTALLALQFARELGSPALRVGYNSLGAFGTINHLHFHSYYLPQTLPCEVAATEPMFELPAGGGSAAPAVGSKRRRSSSDVSGCYDGMDVAEGSSEPVICVSRLVDYPVRGFVIEALAPDAAGPAAAGAGAAVALGDATMATMAALLGRACSAMAREGVAHNFVACDGGARVFVFPQRYSERQARGEVAARFLDTGVNPAAFEIAGHLLLKRQEDYEAASEGWARDLLEQVSLEEARFLQVASLCFGGAAAAAARPAAASSGRAAA